MVVARPGAGAPAQARARGGGRCRRRPVLRSRGEDPRRQPEGAAAEVRDPRADRRADRDRVFQLPPGALLVDLRDRPRGRRRRAHGVPRFRPRARRARAAAAARARDRRLAGRGALGAGPVISLFGLDPATYRPHAIHTGERTYPETNCYTDIVVELLHAHGDEPLAAMGFLVRMDFEGDQWTFFKPPPEDLETLFGVDGLPPYTELVRFDAGSRLEGEVLRGTSRALLRQHLERRPATNPFDRFSEHLTGVLPRLVEGESSDYHAYAFATVRLVGSAFEIAASYVDWLLGGGPAAESFTRIVEGSKTLSLKLARQRAFDPAPTLYELGCAWDEGMHALEAA